MQELWDDGMTSCEWQWCYDMSQLVAIDQNARTRNWTCYMYHVFLVFLSN